MDLTGTIVGYDPGGNASHGVAAFTYESGALVGQEIATLSTAKDVIEFAGRFPDLIAIGIDTLTYWSTGPSGWRPADRWLRNQYKLITNSIASANSLFGSMGLNGMSVLVTLRETEPGLIIVETHPKVLYYELSGKKYNYKAEHADMDSFLSKLLITSIKTTNDHEWDAALSIFSVVQGLTRKWSNDLHRLKLASYEQLVKPCGETFYWWPR